MYYTIVAEEKTIKHSQMNSSIFTKSNALTTLISSPLDDKQRKTSDTFNSRTNNLSFLVGTSIHMNYSTSFLNSQTLRSLAPIIQNSYKTFIVSFIIILKQHQCLSNLSNYNFVAKKFCRNILRYL